MSTTSPDRTGTRQRGFSVVTALFVIVILAALGAFLVTIGSSQQTGLAQDVVGTRVLLAARSGLDWGVHQTMLAGSVFRTNCAGAGGASATISGLTGMPGVTVAVGCTSAAYNEGASTLRSYQLVATACNGLPCPNTVAPPAQYVERRVTALVVN